MQSCEFRVKNENAAGHRRELVLGMERALPFYGFHKGFLEAGVWEGAGGVLRRATLTNFG